jgi:Cysteine dioxygenase type I
MGGLKEIESIAGLVEQLASTRRELGPVELEGLVGALAGLPHLWRPHVHHEQDRRIYRQLYREPDLDVWLICWDARQETGLHDHDRSAGAVRVVTGTLLEDFFAAGGDGSIGLRTVSHPADASFSFDASYIHDVRHDGGEPAVSIHAYAPALWRMGYYAVGPRGLGRTSLTYVDEIAA